MASMLMDKEWCCGLTLPGCDGRQSKYHRVRVSTAVMRRMTVPEQSDGWSLFPVEHVLVTARLKTPWRNARHASCITRRPGCVVRATCRGRTDCFRPSTSRCAMKLRWNLCK